MNNEQDKLKTPFEYIKESWRMYIQKDNFIYFAKIMAVLTIFVYVPTLLNSYLYPSDYIQNGDFSNVPMLILYILIIISSIVFGLWSQSSQYQSILKLGEDEKGVLKAGYKNMLKFFVISLVTGLIVIFGLILLIIPAIIFGVWYSFSVWFVFDKGMKVGDALKSSRKMVKGKFWKVLGRSVVINLFIFIVTILISAIPYFGKIVVTFIAPLFLLPYYFMYRDLSNKTSL